MYRLKRKYSEENLQSLHDIFLGYCRLDPTSYALNVQLLPLSQSDTWMTAAGIFNAINLTTTETGLAFFKFRKRALSYEEYLIFLGDLASSKNLNLQDIIYRMRKVGEPTTSHIMLP